MSDFFSFNIYSSLLLPSFCQGLLFCFLSLKRFFNEGRQCDLYLGILLILLTVRISYWMLGFAGWYDSHDRLTSFMFYFPFNTYIFIGPCLYFYFLSTTDSTFTINRSLYPHLVIPVAFSMLCCFKFTADYGLNYPFKISSETQYGTHGPMAQLDKTEIVYAISYTSIVYDSWLVLLKFKRYKNYLKQNFSDLSELDFSWFRHLIIFVIAAMCVNLAFYLLKYFCNDLSYQIKWYSYFILGFVIYYIGINGYFNHPILYRQLHFQSQFPVKSNESIVIHAHAKLPELNNLKLLLEKLMDTKQMYLDPNLSLTGLSKKLGILPQTLSRVINEGYKMNFNDYVNHLRIIEITKQLQNGAHKRFSLMGIAYESGFSSKTTFNRAFKKFKNCTPSEFINNL